MHSAHAEVIPDSGARSDPPGIQPEQAQDAGARPRRMRGWIVIAAAALALGIVLLVAIRSKTPTLGKSSKSVSVIATQVLRLKGTTEAVQSRSILAPLLAGQQVPTLTIIRLTAAGTRVKQGDLLVEFDRQAQMKDFVDKQAEDNLHKTELEIQKAEIVSRIDAEKNQENLDEAKATFEQLRTTFDLKRKAAQAAIRILEIQRDRTQQTMLHAQANADLMQIHSPLNGVVVLNTIWKQGTMGEVQEGDQVRPGVPFMQVVNPAIMQVRVLANQQDFPSLQAGQTAKVRLDAYPDLVFAAKLDQLAPIGEGGEFSNKLRTFVVIVSIEGNDPKLMPDLSAAVDVDLASQSAGSTVAAAAGKGSQ